MENKILKRIAELAGCEIKFKNEVLLTGTAWISGLPIDLSIVDGHVKLNGVGAFSGNSKALSKGEWRGKGKFKSLVPFIKIALIEMGYEPELYLTPLSPVWKRNYNLVEDEFGRWKIIL